MNHSIKGRDLIHLVGWLAAALACLTPLLALYWLIGDTEIFEYKWLWSLSGLCAILFLAQRKACYPLVLGLGSTAFWIKAEPLFAVYLLLLASTLYCILRGKSSRHNKAYWVTLCLGVVVLPKCLPLLLAQKPAFWLWFREALLLGFFLRHVWLYHETRNESRPLPRLVEHLGYVFFIPQLLGNLNIRSSDLPGLQHLPWPRNLPGYFKILLLAASKFALFHILSSFGAGIDHEGAHSFPDAWVQIGAHYLLWYLWLSAHFDMLIALARFTGVNLPSNFDFPLLATSFRQFWKRWHVFHHRFLYQLIYIPMGGRATPLKSIVVTYLVSALLLSSTWIGSTRWTWMSGFFVSWLPFLLLAGLGLYAEWRCGRQDIRHPAIHVFGWIYTHGLLALGSLLLLGQNRFPGDNGFQPSDAWQLFLTALGISTGS